MSESKNNTQPVVDKEYEFYSRDLGELLVRGRVLEVVDDGRTARVQPTKPTEALRRLAKLGESEPEAVPAGETLMVFLPLVVATRKQGRS